METFKTTMAKKEKKINDHKRIYVEHNMFNFESSSIY